MGSPFVNIHTHLPSHHGNGIEIIQCQPTDTIDNHMFASAGIHPWQLDDTSFDTDSALAMIEEKIGLWAAIGEAGIDKTHRNTIELQKEIFRKQVILSEKHSKPMIIHNVRAHSEIIAMRSETKARQPWIVHGFSGNALTAKQLTDKGMYISVGKNLLNPKSKTADSLKSIPLDRLFAETDTADTPIKDIYACIACALVMDIEELKDVIYLNFKQIFTEK